MPGPNDQHIVEDGTAMPGLGADEPSDEQKAGIRSKSAAAMLKMKEELALAGAELSEKERALVAQEEALIKREREVKAKEDALDRQTKKVA